MVEVEIKEKLLSSDTAANDGGDIETTVKEVDVLRGGEMIRRHSGPNGSLCFAVRRPGTYHLYEVPTGCLPPSL
jgi:hypothetical protein